MVLFPAAKYIGIYVRSMVFLDFSSGTTIRQYALEMAQNSRQYIMNINKLSICIAY